MTKKHKDPKKSDIPGFEKQVIDSLTQTRPVKHKKEEKEDDMRCKVDIYMGNETKQFVDTFIVNTKNLEETVNHIIDEYNPNVQFKITDLYTDKIVAKRFVYTEGISKERMDVEHYNRMYLTIKRIQEFISMGKSTNSIAAKSFVDKVKNLDDEGIKQFLRNHYGNQSLGMKEYMTSNSGSKLNSKNINSEEEHINDNEEED